MDDQNKTFIGKLMCSKVNNIKMKLRILLVIILSILSPVNGQIFKQIPILNSSHKSFGVSLIDFDGDNRTELFVMNMGEANQVYKFTSRGDSIHPNPIITGDLEEEKSDSFCVCWGDVDLDGKLDAFIGNFNSHSRLFVQKDQNKLTKAETNKFPEIIRPVQSCAFLDLDNDGDLDLLIGTKLGGNLFLKNNKGVFKSESLTNWTDRPLSTHSILVHDLNENGKLDVINIQNDSVLVNEVLLDLASDQTEIKALKSGVVSIGANLIDIDNDLDYDLFITNALNKQNRLLINSRQLDFSFQDVGDLTSERFGSMSSCWADFDHDGNIDVFIANSGNSLNSLFLNKGNLNFTRGRITNSSELYQNSSRGCSCGDVDNDGDIDLVVSNAFGLNDTNYILLNQTNDNNYVKFILDDMPPLIPYNTRIELYYSIEAKKVNQTRMLQSTNGSYGMNSLSLHFGVPQKASKIRAKVIWPDGKIRWVPIVEKGQTYYITK